MKTALQIARELQALQLLEDGKSVAGTHPATIRRRLIEELTAVLTTDAAKPQDATNGAGDRLASLLRAIGLGGAGMQVIDLSHLLGKRPGDGLSAGEKPESPRSALKKTEIDIEYRVCAEHGPEEITVTIDGDSYNFERQVGHADLTDESVPAFEDRVINSFEDRGIKTYLAQAFRELNAQAIKVAKKNQGDTLTAKATLH